MKRISSVILILTLVLSFASCNLYISDPDETKVYSDVDEKALLAVLNENITPNSNVYEIVAAFEEMCKTPVEDDLLLLEYGVYRFTGEKLFYFDLVRQYPDGDGEYYQLRVSLTFAPDNENAKLRDTAWSDSIKGSFFDYVRRSSGYKYAQSNQIKAVDIRIDQT